MSVESLLARLRGGPLPQVAVTDVTPVQLYSRKARTRNGSDTANVTAVTGRDQSLPAVTAVTRAGEQPLQREPYEQAACTAVTDVTSQIEEVPAVADASAWLATVAAHLDFTPDALLTAGVILPDEVADYRDRDPAAVADALRRAMPGSWPAREPDDRRHCVTCWNLTGNRCSALGVLVLDDIPRRCADYLSFTSDPDQRSGRDRWPSLKPET